MFNSAKGLLSQRRRERKKKTFPLVFISSTLEKKTFTANFAQSAENNADPVFIKSDICMWIISTKSENKLIRQEKLFYAAC